MNETFECNAGEDCWHHAISPGFFAEDPVPGKHDTKEGADWCTNRHLRWEEARIAAFTVPVVTVHLPMEMGAAGQIMMAVASQFPEAKATNAPDGSLVITAYTGPKAETALETELRTMIEKHLKRDPEAKELAVLVYDLGERLGVTFK